jgi:hypothetical protein
VRLRGQAIRRRSLSAIRMWFDLPWLCRVYYVSRIIGACPGAGGCIHEMNQQNSVGGLLAFLRVGLGLCFCALQDVRSKPHERSRSDTRELVFTHASGSGGSSIDSACVSKY